jgi:NTP pyrophosphatase (non-canonical NTP hydrolase)
METKDIPTQPVSEWQPTTDKLTLALLGKLGEEVNELGSAICRCIIQGLDEVQPVTKKPNREWLEEEIADVLALAFTAMARLDLDHVAIERRRQKKTAYKEPWFASFESATPV